MLFCFSLVLQILHISEVDVRETKMMGSSPIIIVAVRTSTKYLYLCYWKNTWQQLMVNLEPNGHFFVQLSIVSNTADLLCA